MPFSTQESQGKREARQTTFLHEDYLHWSVLNKEGGGDGEQWCDGLSHVS